MERADFNWKYEDTCERIRAQRRHPALFLEYIHPSACAPKNIQIWKSLGSSYDRANKRSDCPRQHELGPISFNFVSTGKRIPVSAEEVNTVGSDLEQKVLDDETFDSDDGYGY
jgi:hypothetical protein